MAISITLNNQYLDRNVAQNISWTNSDSQLNARQTSYEVQYKLKTASSWNTLGVKPSTATTINLVDIFNATGIQIDATEIYFRVKINYNQFTANDGNIVGGTEYSPVYSIMFHGTKIADLVIATSDSTTVKHPVYDSIKGRKSLEVATSASSVGHVPLVEDGHILADSLTVATENSSSTAATKSLKAATGVYKYSANTGGYANGTFYRYNYRYYRHYTYYGTPQYYATYYKYYYTYAYRVHSGNTAQYTNTYKYYISSYTHYYYTYAYRVHWGNTAVKAPQSYTAYYTRYYDSTTGSAMPGPGYYTATGHEGFWGYGNDAGNYYHKWYAHYSYYLRYYVYSYSTTGYRYAGYYTRYAYWGVYYVGRYLGATSYRYYAGLRYYYTKPLMSYYNLLRNLKYKYYNKLWSSRYYATYYRNYYYRSYYRYYYRYAQIYYSRYTYTRYYRYSYYTTYRDWSTAYKIYYTYTYRYHAGNYRNYAYRYYTSYYTRYYYNTTGTYYGGVRRNYSPLQYYYINYYTRNYYNTSGTYYGGMYYVGQYHYTHYYNRYYLQYTSTAHYSYSYSTRGGL